MRIVPRSIFGRLLGIAVITTIVALAVAALAIGHVLERFVMRGLDQQLDAQVHILALAVRRDGTLDPARAISLPAFAEAGGGWGWRVDGPAGHWARGAALASPPSPDRPYRDRERRPPGDDLPWPGEVETERGGRAHFRQIAVSSAVGPVLLTAAGPRRVAMSALREAMVPLLGSLGLLGIALGSATLVQLRYGLRPLRRLRHDLAEVRAARARSIPTDQPSEITPLVQELNALIEQNEKGLAHARRHVSNLAHGMKTPLAVLGMELAQGGRDADGRLGEMVAQIDRRVRHHLGRARAAAPGAARARTALAPAVRDILAALQRIHAERGIETTVEIPAEHAVAIDPQDLDEMAGNLLDNAFRHARSHVHVSAWLRETHIELAIDDDGNGLSEVAVEEAFVPGRRLDERGDGHGFGLSIAAELAELNGGSLTIGKAPLTTGLRALLKLPA